VHVNRFLKTSLVGMVAFGAAGVLMRADDWPEIRGKGRLGVWKETDIVDKFPEGALADAREGWLLGTRGGGWARLSDGPGRKIG
jgi:hypothetical protein